MCIYIAVIATILAVMLWQVDSTAALKYSGYVMELLLAGYFGKSSVHCKGVYSLVSTLGVQIFLSHL